MSDNVNDPAEGTDSQATDASETVSQSVATTVAAYGAALKDTLTTLKTIIANAPSLESIIDTDIQGLVDDTKDKIEGFVEYIADDVENLISSGG